MRFFPSEKNGCQECRVDQFPYDQQQVEDTESRQGAAHPGQTENSCDSGRTHCQHQAPDLGPRQDNEQKADVDQVADVDDDGEKSERAHSRIVPFLFLTTAVGGHSSSQKKEEKCMKIFSLTKSL